ncbi:MAG: cyclic peptide export ABC transporter [Pseudomonadota bacterium]|nr:cyclic peptide export ABC transporter [Pseudomonadota bacterium]
MLKNLYSQFKWPLLISSIASAACAVFGVLTIAAVHQVLALAELNKTVLLNALLFAFLLFCTGVVSQLIFNRVAQNIMYQLRAMLVKRILDTSSEVIEQIGRAKIMSALTADVPALSNFFTILPFCFYHGLLLLGGFAYLAYLSPQLAVSCFLLLVCGYGATFVLLKRMNAIKHQARYQQDQVYEGFCAAVDGHKEMTLNSIRRQRFYQMDFLKSALAVKQFNIRSFDYWVLSGNWGVFLVLATICALFYLSEWFAVDMSELIGFALVLFFLRTSLQEVFSLIPTVMDAKVAYRKIQSLNFAEYSTEFFASAKQSPNPFPIKLEGVTYHYKGSNGVFSLGPIDFTLKQGEVVFIVGGNGSGKTTFAKLLTGSYTPTRGQITCGNDLIGNDTELVECYKSNFSIVYSQYFLFERLVGPKGAPDEALVIELLFKMRMDKLSQIEKQRFTEVFLSTGQQKRLALINAIAEMRPILVLDEWAAEQDPEFKHYFYRTLLPYLKQLGFTLVLISHDDHYFDCADRVIKFQDGTAYELAKSDQTALYS